MRSYPRKAYFRDRTLAQKRRLDLDDTPLRNVQSGVPVGSLVQRVDELSQNEGIVIAPLLPDDFYMSTQTPQAAARRAFHHIKYVPMSQPKTKGEALESAEIPLQIRERDFDKLTDAIGPAPETGAENSQFNLGYSFRPVQGRDRDKRNVPFVWIADAARIFSYSNQISAPIDVEDYSRSQRVSIEGASVVLGVPSRRQKQPRYRFKLENVPIKRSAANLATVLSLRPSIAHLESGEPLLGEMPHERYNTRYNYLGDREGSANQKTLYPHHLAGYMAIIADQWDPLEGKKNLTPLEMCPIALPSRHQMEFDKRVRNNVLVYDRNVRSKNHLRRVYVAERSLLLGRALVVFGNNDFAFCDAHRDGRLADYNSWKWEE